jgi:hypothetical protein
LTGVLFDWQGHYDRIVKRPASGNPKPWMGFTKCHGCDATVPSKARRCPRCAGPLSPRILPRLMAVIGLGTIVGVFALCAHLLGGSVPEQKAPAPLGQWSNDDDIVIVEVPAATASPFSYPAPAANGSSSSGGGLATR